MTNNSIIRRSARSVAITENNRGGSLALFYQRKKIISLKIIHGQLQQNM